MTLTETIEERACELRTQGHKPAILLISSPMYEQFCKEFMVTHRESLPLLQEYCTSCGPLKVVVVPNLAAYLEVIEANPADTYIRLTKNLS